MRVCITGGTGSLGQALTYHFLRQWADRVVVFSRDELKQAVMCREIEAQFPGVGPQIRMFLGDVRNRRRMVKAFHGCDVVVHAAALKRVDAVACHMGEIKATNIDGTENVIDAALEAGVGKVLLISSDKAVEPTNAYGASKQMAEHLAIGANSITYPQGTRVSVLRYGNVLGSRGTVVHLWRQQVAAGQPIKLTHWEMTRFWITLQQACELVTAVLEQMDGGEIFVPQLPALELRTLAQAIGGPGYNIEIMGLRPGGEKIHETLLSSDELPRTEVVRTGLMIPPHFMSWSGRITRGLPRPPTPYTSATAGRLTIENMRGLLADVP